VALMNGDVLAERDTNIPVAGYNWKYKALLENDGFYARLCGKLQY